jgi:cytochrome P450
MPTIPPSELPGPLEDAVAAATGSGCYTTPEPVRAMWRQCPVREVTTASGGSAWLVTGMEQVRAVLSDERFSRAEARRLGAVIGPAAVFSRPGINDLDAPEHTRQRRLVAAAFTARRIRALRPRIQQLADELIADLVAAGPPADLTAGLSYSLPIATICEILGVPYADKERFTSWADRVVSLNAYPPEEAMAALRALIEYTAELIATKRREPDDSLLHALITARDEADRLTEDELINLGCGLLLAGYESTATMLGKGLIALLDNSDQLDRLRADPSLVPNAVEEVLRYATLGVRPHGGLIRATTDDVELDGVTIPAHTVVHAANPAANFDPATFPDADRFDITRPNAADHVTFGYGMHRCLGAQLARMELEVAFGSVLAAFPGLRLAGSVADVRYTSGKLITGVRELRVTW